MAGVSFSKDGSRVGFQVSKGGADWTEAIIINASDKKVLEDTIRNIKFSGIHGGATMASISVPMKNQKAVNFRKNTKP